MITWLMSLVNSPIGSWHLSDVIFILFLVLAVLALGGFLCSFARCGGPSVIMRGRHGRPPPMVYK